MSKISRKSFISSSAALLAGIPLSSLAIPAYDLPDKAPLAKGDAEAKKMRISVFSKTLQWLDQEALGSFVAEAGFDGIDLTVRPGGHVEPAQVKTALPKLVKAIERGGSKVLMMTTAISDATDKVSTDIIQTAADSGIKSYRMNWLTYNDKIDIAANLEAFKKRMSALAEVNARAGIRADYQNHAGSGFGAVVWDLYAVLKDLDPQWMACQFDIRHAAVEASGSWSNALKLIQNHIGSIVFKDCLWVNQNNRMELKNVPLGEGMVDFKQYVSLLKKYNLSKPVSVHYEYDLGGAENGAKSTSMPANQIAKALIDDLLKLRNWLRSNGLG